MINLILNLITFRTELKWDENRCNQILNELVRDGVAWLDNHNKSYWFPSFFSPLIIEEIKEDVK